MARIQSNYFVYHYELMNDNRFLLIFEPNVFEKEDDAIFHANALAYLSGRDFNVCQEKDISKLELITKYG